MWISNIGWFILASLLILTLLLVDHQDINKRKEHEGDISQYTYSNVVFDYSYNKIKYKFNDMFISQPQISGYHTFHGCYVLSTGASRDVLPLLLDWVFSSINIMYLPGLRHVW